MEKIALRGRDARHDTACASMPVEFASERTKAANARGVLNETRRNAGMNKTAPQASLHDIVGADNFVEQEGLRFAGTHLILDLWQASNLDDLAIVENAMRTAAKTAGATLLNIDLHSFTPTGGITGVAILAESHISIHTWPEHAYAAVDVFMCGDAKPHKAVDVLRLAFTPANVTLVEHKRGLMP